ncbi:MAG: PDZ domain-containing protein [Planctomycetota bacterium]|nr:MAG: PDZ domain-containing protein [Planctomycetota bacterium]REJ92922.1 MAG: PDZ domain-containing protein [Planctomycetota bacterium]REK26149.1 MAG: PDZ domain-containing protein [Planctomycetota bacterium]REK33518.1 MAG: PDZ domain-containing protein [Planctomycetota bacterium]
MVLGGIAMLSGLSAIAAETASSDPASDPSILRLISRLGDDEFQVRRQAERDLQQLGAAAIDPLAAEAVRQDPVIARSAVSLLEKLFVDGCIDVADRAERALESLADSQHPYAGEMARSALAGNQQLRERRAVAAIRELGGKVEYQSPSDAQLANMQFGWNFSLDDNRIPGVPLAVVHVWLLKGWQGGEEGLWHVQRLEDSWSARLWGVEVTNVRGSGVTTEQVQSLAASIPNLTVHERGAGLGIKASPVGECIVSDVLANGAAEHAGIMRGDVIVGFDDKPIESFNDLVSLLLERTPDEVVEIDVQRGLERVTLPVTLRGWRDMDTGGRKDPPPLSPDPAETDRPIFVPFQPPRER